MDSFILGINIIFSTVHVFVRDRSVPTNTGERGKADHLESSLVLCAAVLCCPAGGC